MFSKAPRFPTKTADEIPGPNAYDPMEPQAHWKQGVFADHPATQSRKPSSSAAAGSENRKALSSSTRANIPAGAAVPTTATSQKQLGKLEQQLARTTAALEDLQHAKTQVDNERTTLATDLRLAQQREAKLKAALEKCEKQAAGYRDKSTRYNELQQRIEELQKVHVESKEKRTRENKELTKALEAEREKRRAAEESAAETIATLRSELNSWKGKVTSMEEEGQKRLDEQRRDKERELREVKDVQDRKQEEKEALLRSQLFKAEQEAADHFKALEAERAARRQASNQEMQTLRHELEQERVRLRQAILERDQLQEEIEDLERDRQSQVEMQQHNLTVMAHAAALAVTKEKEAASSVQDHLRAQLLTARQAEAKWLFVAKEKESQMQEVIKVVHQVQEDREAANLMARLADLDLAVMLDERRRDREVEAEVLAMDSLAESRISDEDSCAPSDLELSTPGSSQLDLDMMRLDLETETARVEQLQNEVAHLHQSLLSSTAECKASQASQAETSSQLDALRAEAAAKQSQIDLLTEQIGHDAASKAELAAAIEAASEAKKQVKVQIDANKALAAALNNAKVAEAALIGERANLESYIEQSSNYRELYEKLSAQTRELMSRHALAESEKASLSALTNTLLSHENPAQKIIYLDRIRRELDEAKGENVTLRLELEEERSWREEIERELRTYKAVDLPLHQRPKAEMTRVRRVDVASYLALAASTTAATAPTEGKGTAFAHEQDERPALLARSDGAAVIASSSARPGSLTETSSSSGATVKKTQQGGSRPRASLVNSGSLRVAAAPSSSLYLSSSTTVAGSGSMIPIRPSSLGIKASRTSDIHAASSSSAGPALAPIADTSQLRSSASSSLGGSLGVGSGVPIESTPHTKQAARDRRRAKMRPSLVVGGARRVPAPSSSAGNGSASASTTTAATKMARGAGKSSLTIIHSEEEESADVSISFDPHIVRNMARGGGWIDDEAEGEMTIDELGR